MSNQLDKPVDTILEDYSLLDINVIQNHNSIAMSACKLWRMNLCAVSNEIPCTFYVAMNYRIKVYVLETISSPFKDPVKTLASPTASELGAGAESPFIINAIKVGKMLEKEVLISVSENGEICIWRTEDLDAPPWILDNYISTWGVAIHGEQGLLAVSANNYKITVYNLLEITKDNPVFGKRRIDSDMPNHLGSTKIIRLVGHEHNIPNIDFDETGRFIASASIDSTCKIWDITTKQVVTEKRAGQRHSRFSEQDTWCWSVKFIKPGNFKYAVCSDKQVVKTFLHRIDQGRSTSLSNMGLCHSATHPAFPMNMSRIFDLDANDIDFTIYENEGDELMNEARWDEALLAQENDYMEEVYERQRQEDGANYNNGGAPFVQDRVDTDGSVGAELITPNTREVPDEQVQQQNSNFRRLPVSEETSNSGWTIINNPIPSDPSGWGNHISAIPIPPDSSESSGPEATRFELPTSRSISRMGPWCDRDTFDSESEEEEMSEPEELPTNDISPVPSYCIPNIIRTTSSSSLSKMQKKMESRKKRSKKVKKKNSMGQYLMITTGKDVALASTTIPQMKRIRVEHNIISKVDIRSDPLLTASERINMVEWLPELELFVAAGQNGTVALMRVIQIDLDGEKQCCIFNNEHYLPNDILQSTPLYGITVKRVQEERFAPVTYQIFLFYYNGNVLAYNVSRKESNITVDDLVL